METPLLVDAYALRKDSGGPGEFRGGLGIERRIRVLADDVRFVGHGGRQFLPAWGLAGGGAGAVGGFYRICADGREERLSSVCTSAVFNKNDVLRILTPGGGGFGDPKRRSHEAVQRDLAEEKISLQAALDIYGYTPGEDVP